MQVGLETAFQWPSDADETAITLRLRPVPTRRRLLGDVPRDFAAIIGGAVLLVGVALMWSGPPVDSARESLASEAVETLVITTTPVATVSRPKSDAGPILASGLAPARAPVDVDDSEDEDEIIIFDDTGEDDEIRIFEEPARPKPRTKRATSRSREAARRHATLGRRARKAGNRRGAQRHFRAALDASPSHAAAAAALAELSMKDRHYRSALRYAKQASRNAPRNAEYMLLLGDAYFLAKKRTTASDVWRKAAALGSAKARRRLGS